MTDASPLPRRACLLPSGNLNGAVSSNVVRAILDDRSIDLPSTLAVPRFRCAMVSPRPWNGASVHWHWPHLFDGVLRVLTQRECRT
jgi:hypothetical protein